MPKETFFVLAKLSAVKFREVPRVLVRGIGIEKYPRCFLFEQRIRNADYSEPFHVQLTCRRASSFFIRPRGSRGTGKNTPSPVTYCATVRNFSFRSILSRVKQNEKYSRDFALLRKPDPIELVYPRRDRPGSSRGC